VRDALRRVARPRRRRAERFDGQFSTFSALYKQMGVPACTVLHKARLNNRRPFPDSRGDCRLHSILLAPQLSSPKDLQLRADSFLRRHVVSPTMWTHVDEGLRELIDAGRAFLVLAEGGHETFSGQAVR